MTFERTKRSWRAEKLSHLGSSIFTEVAEWKEEARSSGKEIIDLGIGSPDRGPTVHIRNVLSEAVLDESSYAYPGTSGTLSFRQQAAAWMKHRFEVDVNPNTELLALMGSQDGLAHLAQAICNPGDLAIVPDPGYPIYSGSLAIAGVKPWYLPLKEENHFLPDLDSVPDQVWEEAVFILLNIPGNPIAVTADTAFYEKLIRIATQWNVLIVHDLAYSEMAFDDYRPMSILELPGAKDIAVEFHSFSKSFNMAGCRIGFLTGNSEVISALRDLKSNIDYGVFEPIQVAAIAALEEAMNKGKGDRGVAPLYEARRNAFAEALAAEGWNVPKPKATMFVWAPLPACFKVAERDAEAWTSRKFARELLLDTGVVVIPGEAFGSEGEGYVRIALVQEQEILMDAARRMGKFIREYEMI
ncbi:aminotransferase class I/II-fold pyridoxal phosphate-dependent enzyme [Paenibacillus sp. PDC88]|uniref:aminotransferase class I/II-fold pyridoxal phosphate-dependent enzyme n=1 Tax=Paenibacillus sp. PDC88 TaxID=1884375 RepID=UPI00089B531B|nr:aminotransferase class I/II-fold pyridoxal phosphate-dependent enzyme [Paenibacillus sp. PDC88]SDW07312.1 LL-diaminopimelate aminotransferase [Paenibacillus sp. PDC88]